MFFIAKLWVTDGAMVGKNTTDEDRIESFKYYLSQLGDEGNFAVLERIDGDLYRVKCEARVARRNDVTMKS